jgi:hypothetical protein
MASAPTEKSIAGNTDRNIFLIMQVAESPIQLAEEAGFDLSLVRESLRLTYDERAQRHEAALPLAMELQRIGQNQRAQSKPITQAPRYGGY